MKHEPVSSSQIQSVGYDPDTSTMEVVFNTGAVYQYYEVPETLYRQMMEATSIGRFFGSEVRGQYKYEKV